MPPLDPLHCVEAAINRKYMHLGGSLSPFPHPPSVDREILSLDMRHTLIGCRGSFLSAIASIKPSGCEYTRIPCISWFAALLGVSITITLALNIVAI